MGKRLAPKRRMRLELSDRLVRDGGVELAAEVDERVAQAEHRAESQRVADKPIPVDRATEDGDRVGEPDDVRRLARPRACEADPKELVRGRESARLGLAEGDRDRLGLDLALGNREVAGETLADRVGAAVRPGDVRDAADRTRRGEPGTDKHLEPLDRPEPEVAAVVVGRELPAADDDWLLEAAESRHDGGELELVQRPGAAPDAAEPRHLRVVDSQALELPVHEREHREAAELEPVEVELRPEPLPGLGARLAPDGRGLQEQLLPLAGPERPAEPGLVHASARRRSSAAFSTCRYCGFDSRRRMPLFSACRRRSSTTTGGTALRRPSSFARACQSTPMPTLRSVENTPTRRNDPRLTSMRFGVGHGTACSGARRSASAASSGSGLRNSVTCP